LHKYILFHFSLNLSFLILKSTYVSVFSLDLTKYSKCYFTYWSCYYNNFRQNSCWQWIPTAQPSCQPIWSCCWCIHRVSEKTLSRRRKPSSSHLWWWPVIVVGEAGVAGENHRPWARNKILVWIFFHWRIIVFVCFVAVCISKLIS
jgi:hypothetical protein